MRRAIGGKLALAPLHWALLLSLAAHGGLLTLRFVDPERFNRVFRDTPLEVILVNARSTEPPTRAQAIAQANLAGGGNVDGPFPAATGLEELMRTAPAETALILLRPPVYVTALSKPGTRDAAADAACRKAFADLAARRPRTALVDWRVDRPELRDSSLFFDHSHYRQPISRLVEADIAEAIRKLN